MEDILTGLWHLRYIILFLAAMTGLALWLDYTGADFGYWGVEDDAADSDA